MADPKIGLALGAGAARGIAHIPMLEALDEYGVRPARIAGASVGALMGAARASGMTGAEIRAYTLEATKDTGTMLKRMWSSSRRRTLKEVFEEGLSIQLNSLDVVQAFVPARMAKSFEALAIPFVAVATDYFGWEKKVFSKGELLPAIAASIAIPSFFKPVQIDGRYYIDGYVTNPVPFHQASLGMDYFIGIDVNGGPDHSDKHKTPSAIDVAIVSSQIMQNAITAHGREIYKPDIYIKPVLRDFAAHEFYRVKEILAAGDKEKDNLKRQLDVMLG